MPAFFVHSVSNFMHLIHYDHSGQIFVHAAPLVSFEEAGSALQSLACIDPSGFTFKALTKLMRGFADEVRVRRSARFLVLWSLWGSLEESEVR